MSSDRTSPLEVSESRVALTLRLPSHPERGKEKEGKLWLTVLRQKREGGCSGDANRLSKYCSDLCTAALKNH
jgi:hypothetical protein